VKVLDFGIVKDHQSGGETLMTMQHHVVGTPAYIAPEAILGDSPVDRRADIYASDASPTTRVGATWSRDRAKEWWLTHLAEMCQ